MPPANPTKPNDNRPLHLDLRAKVIASNALIAALTQEVTRLVEAQQRQLDVLTDIAVKLAHPPVISTAAGDMNREAFQSWAAARGAVLSDQTEVMTKPFVGFGGADQTMGAPVVGGDGVPRVTTTVMPPPWNEPPDVVVSNVGQEAYASQRNGIVSSEPLFIAERELPDGSTSYSSLAAQMAAELAEDDAWDEEELEVAQPPPPDNYALWQRRMSSWRGSRLWMPEWGPRPGQEGCKVPPDMMNGRR